MSLLQKIQKIIDPGDVLYDAFGGGHIKRQKRLEEMALEDRKALFAAASKHSKAKKLRDGILDLGFDPDTAERWVKQ